MKTLVRSPKRARVLAGVAATLAAFAVSAAPASAAAVTYTGGGASVEFSTIKVSANLPATQRILVKGTGFVGTTPDAQNTQPVVAFKFDRADKLAGWGSDTGDRWSIADAPTTAAFKASLSTGSFEGWIDLPANVTPEGGGNAPAPTRHIVNILSGTYSTAGASTGNRTAPLGINGLVDALAQPVTGYQQSSATTFFPGTFIPAAPATALKVTGNLDTTTSQPVAVSFDGTAITTAKNFGTQDALTTGVTGDFTASVPVPAGPAGVKILSFSAGGTTQSVAITVTPRTATRQTPQAASAGDTVTVSGTGFRQISGAGQKVGLLMMPGDKLLGCGTADGEGNVSVSGAVPADTALGDKSLWLAVGAACVPMGAVVEPPAGIVQLTGTAGLSVVEKPVATPTPVSTATPAPTATPVPTETPTAKPGVGPTPTPTPTPTPLPNAPKAAKVKSTSKGSSIEITFAADAAGTSVKVGAKTKSKIKLTSKSKAKTVTVASTKTVKASKGKAPKVVIKLTAEGKKLLAARGSLKIVITIQQTGKATVTKTVTIKP